MSNYQFVVFSGKEQNRLGIKREEIITESNESSPSRQNDVDDIDSPLSSRASSSSSSSRKHLIVLPTLESSSSSSSSSIGRKINCDLRKQQHCIESRPPCRRESPINVVHSLSRQSSLSAHQQQHQRTQFDDASAMQLGGKCTNNNAPGKAKIPRPANAFMLFANEWRKKLAVENPRESNKDISVRLGVLWKNMGKDSKEKYFALAREVDAEHKRKYPDYVYNPKEARLRKAMREQSRELSRQSILQTAVASSNENNASATNGCNTNNITSARDDGGDGGGDDSGVVGCGHTDGSVSRNYLSHPMTCASPAPPAATVSSLPGNSTYNSSRIVNPWFPVGHTPSTSHMKPMLTHRVMQAHQQRTFDKTKEVLRKQTECAGAFSTASSATGSCYPGDFTVHGAPTQPTNDPSASGLESNDYCGIGEFTDGQKWHPYQSTTTPYHTRNGPMPKMMSRHGMQSINPHSHTSWNQFCGVPLFSMAPQNSMIRGPRHMVFMHDQQERQCGFINDEIPMAYMSNKMDIGHRLQSGYSQSNYQEAEKCIEDAPRWEAPMPVCPPHLSTMNNHIVTQQRDPESRIKEQHQHQHSLKQQQQQPPPKKEDTKEYNDNNDILEHQCQSTKAPSKQPLPGFHQAFGSTEIGRFSRSEFFANMVGENSGGNGSSSQLIADGYLPVPMFPFPTSSDHLRGNIPLSRSNHPTAEEIIVPNDCFWFAPNIEIPMTNIADPNYVTFMDLSNRLNRDWIHPGSMLSQDYSSALIERPTFLFHDNCPVLITPKQLSSFNEKKNTGNTTTSSSNSSINSAAYLMRNNNNNNNNINNNNIIINNNNNNNNTASDNDNRVDSTKNHVEENSQQDDDDDDEHLINVDDIDC